MWLKCNNLFIKLFHFYRSFVGINLWEEMVFVSCLISLLLFLPAASVSMYLDLWCKIIIAFLHLLLSHNNILSEFVIARSFTGMGRGKCSTKVDMK